MSDADPRVERVLEALRGASEELADLAIDRLTEAVNEGATSRPESERLLTRARAAVDKAINLLESTSANPD